MASRALARAILGRGRSRSCSAPLSALVFSTRPRAQRRLGHGTARARRGGSDRREPCLEKRLVH